MRDVLLSAGTLLRQSGGFGWDEDEFTEERLTTWVRAREGIIARRSGAVVGAALLQWARADLWRDFQNSDAGFLNKLAVARRVRGNGIGDAIINWAVDQVRARNRKYLRLDCGPWPKLCSFYRRLGFEELDRVEINGAVFVRFQRQV
ncbi:MAG: GNAT family N-acetyltransferase [Pseudomonadota bacterium]